MNKERFIKLLKTLDKAEIKYETRKITKKNLIKKMNRKINWCDLNPMLIEMIKNKEIK